jgi:uncharacterized protein involved in exopolysaccharide biosynthesis
MENHPQSEKEQIFHFIRNCFRHWHYFVISGGLFLVITVIYLKTTATVYQIEASAALRHEDSLTGSIGKQSSGLLSAMGWRQGSENIEDETIKMSSQGNIKQVVKALDLNKIYKKRQFFGLSKKPLDDLSPVLIDVDPAIADTMKGMVLFRLHLDKTGNGRLKIRYGDYKGHATIGSFPATISTPVANFTFTLSPEYAPYKGKKSLDMDIAYTNYDYITQIYRNLIVVDFHRKNSDLITLVVHSSNPDLSKKLIWETIHNYNKNWDADKDYLYNSTLLYVNQRLSENTLSLAEADREIQQFKDRNHLTDIEVDVKFYYGRSAEIQQELLLLATKINLMEIIRDFVQDDANRYGLVPFTLAGDDKGVNLFVEKYNDAMIKRNLLRKNQPQSLLLGELEEQLESQRENLIVSIDNERKGLQTALADIKREDAETDRKIGAVPSIEREYIQLKREQELQQNVYVFLLEKREELGIRAVSLMPKLKMINEPYIANKLVSPKPFRTLVTALFFGGILLPLALIYGAPYIRTLRGKK